jgi:hypothetical protein
VPLAYFEVVATANVAGGQFQMQKGLAHVRQLARLEDALEAAPTDRVAQHLGAGEASGLRSATGRQVEWFSRWIADHRLRVFSSTPDARSRATP